MKRCVLVLLVGLWTAVAVGSDKSRCVGRACLAAAARTRHRQQVHQSSFNPEHRQRPRQHPTQRGGHRRNAAATGHCAETGVGAGMQPDCVRRSPHAGRHSDDRFLRALRWPAARPEGMDLATIRTGPAQSGVGKRGPSHPASICGNAVQGIRSRASMPGRLRTTRHRLSP